MGHPSKDKLFYGSDNKNRNRSPKNENGLLWNFKPDIINQLNGSGNVKNLHFRAAEKLIKICSIVMLSAHLFQNVWLLSHRASSGWACQLQQQLGNCNDVNCKYKKKCNNAKCDKIIYVFSWGEKHCPPPNYWGIGPQHRFHCKTTKYGDH